MQDPNTTTVTASAILHVLMDSARWISIVHRLRRRSKVHRARSRSSWGSTMPVTIDYWRDRVYLRPVLIQEWGGLEL